MGKANLKLHTTDTVDTYSPVTGELYKTYHLHSQHEAEQIIENSHQAFLNWRKTSLEERGRIINKFAELLERDKQQLAEMITHQMGKAIDQAEQEIMACAEICRYTAEHGSMELADEQRDLSDGKQGVISYQPLGVILGMQPWNFPFYQCIRYSASVIMGGNTTVFKHAYSCFETASRVAELFEEAGLPEHVFSPIYVTDEMGDELIGHDKVRGVSFTGSAAAGRIVAQEAGKHLKKNVMELGGSDAYLVLEDADLGKAVSECVKGRVGNAGQTCVAAKRFIVVESIYDEFREQFVKAMQAVSYGDPMNRENDMGPLARVDLRDKLHEQVCESIKQGADCLCGGEVPDDAGAFYPATVLENIPENSPAYQEELFGPVACLFRVKDMEAAIELANDHVYGLGGGVFSENEALAFDVARNALETGSVNINSYGIAHVDMPFGGVKDSGYGREHGGFGMKEFTNIKSIIM